MKPQESLFVSSEVTRSDSLFTLEVGVSTSTFDNRITTEQCITSKTKSKYRNYPYKYCKTGKRWLLLLF